MTLTPSDDLIRKILDETRLIACVGASANPARPSHYVSQYLVSKGYRVVGVNPGLAGQKLFGETVVASLRDLSEPVDMIDIFRRIEEIPAIVEDALAHVDGLKTIWMQLGIVNLSAAKMAEDAGLQVIQNRCPKIEIPRLYS